ncbi:M42 family metallopeptidase [Halobacteria archaeon AArc-dxtr1]|nr:M42 family metallopeptidase [Halobacteria archaeon AArc-dxtr1]
MGENSIDVGSLSTLTEIDGVPGYEDRIREHVVGALEGYVDRVQTDAMGNVVGTLDGADPDYEVAVAAHMDEIGFMVRHVRGDDDGYGFLEIDPLGGWDARVLRAQRVTVHTEDGDLPGVIGSPPPHTTDEDDRGEPDVSDCYVDVGLPVEEARARVSVGDLVTMSRSTRQVGQTVTGKALDDRVCLFAMLEAAERLSEPDVTIHFCATVQEEVGLRGARALGVDLDPDLAIALDVTVANDVPEADDGDHVTELGGGTAIKLKDSSVLTNPKVHRRLRETAEDAEIDYQHEVLPAGGTDTAGFQLGGGATPVGALSVPTRYLHTTTEMAHVADIAATVDLLCAFLERENGRQDYTL